MTLHYLLRLSTFLATFLLISVSSNAQDRRPLILSGTNTIYERVLTRPGAILRDQPNGSASEVYPAFQPLYVFSRQDDWLELGPSPTATPAGWVNANETVLWKQNIIGAFTNSAGRSRQLLFEKQEDLQWLLNHEAQQAIQEKLVAEANAGVTGSDSGVVAVEPSEFINIRDELYIMPILDFTETLHPSTYDDILLMQVASVPKENQSARMGGGSAEEFDVGIVFLLDTTQSMEPYIALTQRVIQNTVLQITGNEIGDLVNFGVIGFRDNTNAVSELQYRTKTLVGLERRSDESPVIDAIGAAINVATVSSPGFNEDSLAAVEDAIDVIDWDQVQGNGDPIDARYVILVTDAGPKDPRDPNARSEIGTKELQIDAEGRGIAIMTLHLKTPAGQNNHDYAASQYRELSKFQGKDFYFPIENGSESVFEQQTTTLVTALTDHVRAIRGEKQILDVEDAGSLVDLGRAMQLAWLGRQQGTQAPDVIKGWVSNAAVENPQRVAIEPRLLVTKNELATMADILRKLVLFGEQAQSSTDAMSFFGQVQGLIADMAQNPDLVVSRETTTLGSALEFLERLPYQSQILDMTEERWAQSAMIRRSIIDGMRQKLTQYEKWLRDSSVWTALFEGAPDGSYVFAMPFDILP